MSSPQTFPFLSLPAELRNEIYALALTQQINLTPSSADPQTSHTVALLLTSHRLHLESLPILHSNAIFHIDLTSPTGYPAFKRCISRFPASYHPASLNLKIYAWAETSLAYDRVEFREVCFNVAASAAMTAPGYAVSFEKRVRDKRVWEHKVEWVERGDDGGYDVLEDLEMTVEAVARKSGFGTMELEEIVDAVFRHTDLVCVRPPVRSGVTKRRIPKRAAGQAKVVNDEEFREYYPCYRRHGYFPLGRLGVFPFGRSIC